MKRALWIAVLAALAPFADAAKVGDTYDQVVAEKGPPRSKVEAGSVKVLNYPDSVIKLRDDVVVSVTAVAAPAALAQPADPNAVSAARAADAKRALAEAVRRVENIVNQAVPTVPRTPQMRIWEYESWFHPGAQKPDFNTVDVRRTQEAIYDNQDYVCLKENPDVAFAGRDLEFNAMTKYFYVDRSLPKKKLTQAEMMEINRLYRIIGLCERILGVQVPPAS